MKIKLPLIFASALLLAGCSSESNGKWDDPNPIQPTADLSLSGTEADANDGLNKFGIDFSMQRLYIMMRFSAPRYRIIMTIIPYRL